MSTIERANNNPGWDEYFMAYAVLASQRSKDPCTKVGACIVNDHNGIVSTGYNDMPNGCSEFAWDKIQDDPLNSKQFYVCHAEMNAIVNKNSADVSGCTLYVSLFPCNECAKLIIQSGIKEVVYISDKKHKKNSTHASKRMLNAAKIPFRQYRPSSNMFLDFDEVNRYT